MINPTNEQILNTINVRAETYQDIIIKSEDFHYNCENQEISYNETFFSVTNNALSQFLNRLGIPILFYKRCPGWLQYELIDNFNNKKEFLLRGINTSTPICRAVLSPSFSRERDDKHIFPIILEGLSNIQGLQNKLFTLDNDITTLSIGYPSASVSHEGYDITACVSITNSETGHSSIWIEPALLVDGVELKNDNGENPGITRIRHYGDTPKAEVIKQAVQELNNISQVGVLQYLRATTETVTSKEAIDFVSSINNYPKRFLNIINDELERTERIAKTEILKKVLNSAKDLPILQSLSIKRQVGRFINLFENTKNDFLELKNI